MSASLLYQLLGVALFAIGIHALVVHAHLLRKILAVNVMGTGVFTVLVATGYREAGTSDPVSHAIVLTGIVVAVSATALALALAHRVRTVTGRTSLASTEAPSGEAASGDD